MKKLQNSLKLSSLEFKEQEIKWRTETTYVDVETGEVLPKEVALRQYTITNTKKKTNVYKSSGTIISTKECRRNIQGTIDFGNNGGI